MRKIYLYTLIASGIFFTGAVLLIMNGNNLAGLLFVMSLFLLSYSVRENKMLKGSAFTIVIIASVVAALYYPSWFQNINGFELKVLMIPLLQLIMFGMGTAMSVADFAEVVKSPKSVLIGLACQFTIMPFVGLAIAIAFNFPPEIAAGIILVGSSPSGLASNVMTYLAKANLALSVTLTAIATLLAPLLTPVYMKFLAGQLVPIDFWGMAWGITKIVILPIIAGVLVNKIARGKIEKLNVIMPLVSMFGIAFIIAIIIASGRNDLMTIGFALLTACLLHNIVGYFFGYWASRMFKMDEQSCRTIALEVGLQNSGLASGIALQMGKMATMGLAPAVFSVLMNISGSSLASWWRTKPI